jgi:DNA helicase IV
MRDIVATIAAEQDVVIRAPLGTCLVVQGGPGTGKTAVGLHRAAYLLFEHRVELDRTGVLVVGPNPLFLRYIAQVLPSLGEAATRQTTIERLVGGRVRREDAPAVSRLKGDARMAELLARAVRQHLRPPAEDVDLATPWGRVRLDAATLRAGLEEIAARGVAFAVGRGALRTRLHRLTWLALQEARGEDAVPADVFDESMRANADLAALASRMWPSVSAPALVKRLLTNRRAMADAAGGLLTAEEQAMLRRSGGRRLDDEPWSLPELVLVDEAEAMLNGVSRAYGHVVVDEAQDLSDMELRAVARRCPNQSMTVLGDLAQATAPGAQRSWEEAAVHLGAPGTVRIEELEVGYRVPKPILDVANRLLPEVAPGVRASRSVRVEGEPPTVVTVSDRLAEAVRTAVDELVATWASVGVVVPEAVAEDVRAALAGVEEAVVTVLAPPEAKGLEFDAVVVVEPSAFLTDDERGGRLLYIALTRAVQELVLVHTRPLPAALVA